MYDYNEKSKLTLEEIDEILKGEISETDKCHLLNIKDVLLKSLQNDKFCFDGDSINKTQLTLDSTVFDDLEVLNQTDAVIDFPESWPPVLATTTTNKGEDNE